MSPGNQKNPQGCTPNQELCLTANEDTEAPYSLANTAPEGCLKLGLLRTDIGVLPFVASGVYSPQCAILPLPPHQPQNFFPFFFWGGGAVMKRTLLHASTFSSAASCFEVMYRTKMRSLWRKNKSIQDLQSPSHKSPKCQQSGHRLLRPSVHRRCPGVAVTRRGASVSEVSILEMKLSTIDQLLTLSNTRDP